MRRYVVDEFLAIMGSFVTDEMVNDALDAYARRVRGLPASQVVQAAFEAEAMLERARPEWTYQERRNAALCALRVREILDREATASSSRGAGHRGRLPRPVSGDGRP